PVPSGNTGLHIHALPPGGHWDRGTFYAASFTRASAAAAAAAAAAASEARNSATPSEVMVRVVKRGASSEIATSPAIATTAILLLRSITEYVITPFSGGLAIANFQPVMPGRGINTRGL